MRYLIMYLTFIVYLICVGFRRWKTFLDLEFYKTHPLKLFDVYIYKMMEILLISQYKRRHKKANEKEIFNEVTGDLYYVYKKYFKVNK